MPKKPILIFPAGMPHALEFLQKCLRDGVDVVGSSSLAFDPAREQYPAWVHLPFVTAPEFGSTLTRALIDFDIGGIYTPNPVVWEHLSKVLGRLAPNVSLVNGSPFDEALAEYPRARRQAQQVREHALNLASRCTPKRQISEIEQAAIFRHSSLIPGMCDGEKIRALFEVFRCTVPGDVVEIGSWWGKSAFILARLAHCYNVGHLLCVDPWTNEHLVQGEAMVDSCSAQVDAAEALVIFEMNLLPYSFKHVNYLRMPSTDGALHYRKYRSVTTEAFGSTTYCGKISVLHIDGNHSYPAVKADIASWVDVIMDGGWIIIDDYIWPYGDGPQRAGDEFLSEYKDRIDVVFVMGSALFIQLSLYARAETA